MFFYMNLISSIRESNKRMLDSLPEEARNEVLASAEDFRENLKEYF